MGVFRSALFMPAISVSGRRSALPEQATDALFRLTIQLILTRTIPTASALRPNAGDNATCSCETETQTTHLDDGKHVNLQPSKDTSLTFSGTGRDHVDVHQKGFSLIPNLPFIFSSEAGGNKLCDFLHRTQALLRPPPPRPESPSFVHGAGPY